MAIIEQIRKYDPYIEEIRKRIYSSAIVFLVFFILGFSISGILVREIINIFNVSGVVISTVSPFQFADLALDIGFTIGVLAIFPLFVYHLFSFTAPALTNKEKKWFILIIPVSMLLFLIGFFYGFSILYFTLDLLARLNESFGIKNIWNISMFLSQIFLTSTLLGILFQFPLVLTALKRLEIISTEMLKRKRKVAFAISLVLVALLPPTDGVSLLVMVLPLILLYEVTILINSKK